jgi:PHD/YefM family antitoxin component YafN of YafNO toxin-antitoxin module
MCLCSSYIDFRISLCCAKRPRVITRHGKPAGVLIGFESEDDWFEYRLENDSRFLERVEKARKSLRAGRGVRLDEL